ncbi:MAG: hemerythrin domain-containing protein [Roseiflexaceae bacterium]
MTLQDEVRLLLQAPMMNTHDVRTQLRIDHDELMQVARDMVDADGGDCRRMLLRRLRPSMLVHMQAVRAEVYRSLHRLRGTRRVRSIIDEREADHQALEGMLGWLAKSRKTESMEWASRAQSLLTLLRQHVETEQDEVFTVLGHYFDDAALARMAQSYLAEKTQLSALDGKVTSLQTARDSGDTMRSTSRVRRGSGMTEDEYANRDHSLQA